MNNGIVAVNSGWKLEHFPFFPLKFQLQFLVWMPAVSTRPPPQHPPVSSLSDKPTCQTLYSTAVMNHLEKTEVHLRN